MKRFPTVCPWESLAKLALWNKVGQAPTQLTQLAICVFGVKLGENHYKRKHRKPGRIALQVNVKRCDEVKKAAFGFLEEGSRRRQRDLLGNFYSHMVWKPKSVDQTGPVWPQDRAD